MTEVTKKETKTENLSPNPPSQQEENKKPSADSIAAKRDWCVSQMTPNFFATPTPGNPKEPSVEALDQFQNFVNVICPSLDLNVPSKFINHCFDITIYSAKVTAKDIIIALRHIVLTLNLRYCFRWSYCRFMLPHGLLHAENAEAIG